MANIPDWPARQARTSTIAQLVHDAFPEPPDTLKALRRLIGDEHFPDVFDALQAAPDLGPPPAESGLAQETADRVAQSTVKVEGVACRRIQDGSGSVIGPDLVVTNAHVVAGGEDIVVYRYPDDVEGRRDGGGLRPEPRPRVPRARRASTGRRCRSATSTRAASARCSGTPAAATCGSRRSRSANG